MSDRVGTSAVSRVCAAAAAVGIALAIGVAGCGDSDGPGAQILYAYLTNFAQNSVSQYRVMPDGSFTPLATASVATGTRPAGVTATPSRRFVYVANTGDNTVSQYSVGADGTLTPLVPATVATGAGPSRLRVSPDGRFAYVVNTQAGSVSQYAVGAGGALTPLTPPTVATGASPADLRIEPTGATAYVANSGDDTVSQYQINADGTLAPLSPATVAVGDGPAKLAVHPNGQRLYIVNGLGNSVSIGDLTPTRGAGRLDPVPRQVTIRASFVQVGSSPRDIGIEWTGKLAVVVNSDDHNIRQFGVTADGGLTPVPAATLATGTSPALIRLPRLVPFGIVAEQSMTLSGGPVRDTDVPGLGRIPLIGSLFRLRSTVSDHPELLIIITPTIVDGASDVSD